MGRWYLFLALLDAAQPVSVRITSLFDRPILGRNGSAALMEVSSQDCIAVDSKSIHTVADAGAGVVVEPLCDRWAILTLRVICVEKKPSVQRNRGR